MASKWGHAIKSPCRRHLIQTHRNKASIPAGSLRSEGMKY
jgi:hypothetical protein